MVTLHPTDIFETFSENLNERIGTLPDTASLQVLQEKAWNWSGWIGLVPSLAVLELPHGSDKQGGALFRVHFWHTFFRSNFCFWSLQASPIFFPVPTAFRQKIGSPQPGTAEFGSPGRPRHPQSELDLGGAEDRVFFLSYFF